MRANSVEKLFYEKGRLLTFEEAKAKALLFLEYIKLTPMVKELGDYWYGIADNWDLNIWTENDDPNEQLQMTLYPVVDGVGDYSNINTFYPLTA